MRLRNLLVGVRDIGALIGTPARRHLANQGSKTAEIEARKGKVTPRNKAISAPYCITNYSRLGTKSGPSVPPASATTSAAWANRPIRDAIMTLRQDRCLFWATRGN